jgi:hypothetical protein
LKGWPGSYGPESRAERESRKRRTSTRMAHSLEDVGVNLL